MEVVEKEEGLVRGLRDGGLNKRERVGLGRKKMKEKWVKGSNLAIGVGNTCEMLWLSFPLWPPWPSLALGFHHLPPLRGLANGL